MAQMAARLRSAMRRLPKVAGLDIAAIAATIKSHQSGPNIRTSSKTTAPSVATLIRGFQAARFSVVIMPMSAVQTHRAAEISKPFAAGTIVL
jgi:hypothetical protein